MGELVYDRGIQDQASVAETHGRDYQDGFLTNLLPLIDNNPTKESISTRTRVNKNLTCDIHNFKKVTSKKKLQRFLNTSEQCERIDCINYVFNTDSGLGENNSSINDNNLSNRFKTKNHTDLKCLNHSKQKNISSESLHLIAETSNFKTVIRTNHLQTFSDGKSEQAESYELNISCESHSDIEPNVDHERICNDGNSSQKSQLKRNHYCNKITIKRRPGNELYCQNQAQSQTQYSSKGQDDLRIYNDFESQSHFQKEGRTQKNNIEGQIGIDSSSEMIFTCHGDYDDPDINSKLHSMISQLNQVCNLEHKKKPINLRKIEPWNSVRVTVSLPRAAANRLRELAQRGDDALRDLGILSVQLEGDQVIALRTLQAAVAPNQFITSASGSSTPQDSQNHVASSTEKSHPVGGDKMMEKFKSEMINEDKNLTIGSSLQHESLTTVSNGLKIQGNKEDIKSKTTPIMDSLEITASIIESRAIAKHSISNNGSKTTVSNSKDRLMVTNGVKHPQSDSSSLNGRQNVNRNLNHLNSLNNSVPTTPTATPDLLNINDNVNALLPFVDDSTPSANSARTIVGTNTINKNNINNNNSHHRHHPNTKTNSLRATSDLHHHLNNHLNHSHNSLSLLELDDSSFLHPTDFNSADFMSSLDRLNEDIVTEYDIR